MSDIEDQRNHLNQLIQNGHLFEALRFAEVIRQDSDDPYIWLDYAMLFMSTENMAEAMRELRKLLKAHPDFSHGWHNLAGLLMSDDLYEAESALLMFTVAYQIFLPTTCFLP